MKLEKNSIYLRSEQLKDFKAFMESETHTESHLYINNDLVFKIFKNANDLALMKNKERKINFLMDSKINDFILPNNKVFIDDSFAGYTSAYFNGSQTLDDIVCLPLDKKISLLNKVSLALERIHEQGIVLGDINSKNILFKDNTIKFVDVDSANINGWPCDNYSLALNNQNIDPFNINTIESDIYLLNLLVLELVLYYDVTNMPACDKKTYYNDIRDFNLPNHINNIFLNLYNMVNGDEYSIYPHEYLSDLYRHYKKRTLSK